MRSAIGKFLSFIAFSFALAASPAWGAEGTIKGSLHDLSYFNQRAGGFNAMQGFEYNDYGEICVYCHTPHHGETYAPLWNRATPTTTTYQMYNSETIDTTIPDYPNGISLACLSCHDGTLALDRIINAPGPGGIVSGGSIYPYGNPPSGYPSYVKPAPGHFKLAPNGFGTEGKCGACHNGGFAHNQANVYISQDLRDDHPISMDYPTPSKDPDFNTPAEVGGRKGFDKNTDGRVGSDEIQLFSGKVECASCHNPHYPDEDDSEGRAPFLRVSKVNSGLCLTCHKK